MCMDECGQEENWQLAYYERLAADLRRYRDYRWKIPIWTATFMAAMASTGTHVPLPVPVRIVGALLASLAALFSVWNLHRCYDAYANHKRELDRVERTHVRQIRRGRKPSGHSVWYRLYAQQASIIRHRYADRVAQQRQARHKTLRACRRCKGFVALIWPKWHIDVPWEHKVFRLAWMTLIVAMTVFAVWVLLVAERGRSRRAAKDMRRGTVEILIHSCPDSVESPRCVAATASPPRHPAGGDQPSRASDTVVLACLLQPEPNG